MGMAQMQSSIWTGCKSENGWCICIHIGKLNFPFGHEKSKSLQPHLKSINTEADLQRGLKQLQELDHEIVPTIEGLQVVPLRSRPPGFEGLAEIIVAQQLSKASAMAIFGRLKQQVVPFVAEEFLDAGEKVWVDAGLSRAKQETLKGLANEMVQKKLDLDDLCKLPPAQAMDELTALKGIGPWTAEVFLMFCAGHPDIFPAGDVALQHVVGWLLGCDDKPDAQETRSLAERWRPLRSVAARICYAEYARRKGWTAAPL